MLAIGDGANDVAMIQAADIGVGIAGKEGRSAVNNSDFGLTQFRYLQRLLLVHGQLSQHRLSNLIKYSFYKNIAFAMVNFYFQFFNGFSGQTLTESIASSLYNAIFTAAPITVYALFDRPVQQLSMLEDFPAVYNTSSTLRSKIFWKTGILQALLTACACFFVPYFGIPVSDGSSVHGLFSLGKVAYMCLLGCVSLEVLNISRYPTNLLYLAVGASYTIVYIFFLLMDAVADLIDRRDLGTVGAQLLFTQPVYWFTVAVVYAMTFIVRFMERFLKYHLDPDPSMKLAQYEARQLMRKARSRAHHTSHRPRGGV